MTTYCITRSRHPPSSWSNPIPVVFRVNVSGIIRDSAAGVPKATPERDVWICSNCAVTRFVEMAERASRRAEVTPACVLPASRVYCTINHKRYHWLTYYC